MQQRRMEVLVKHRQHVGWGLPHHKNTTICTKAQEFAGQPSQGRRPWFVVCSSEHIRERLAAPLRTHGRQPPDRAMPGLSLRADRRKNMDENPVPCAMGFLPVNHRQEPAPADVIPVQAGTGDARATSRTRSERVCEEGGIVKAGRPWRWSGAREIRHRQAPKTPLDDATQRRLASHTPSEVRWAWPYGSSSDTMTPFLLSNSQVLIAPFASRTSTTLRNTSRCPSQTHWTVTSPYMTSG